MSKDLKFIQWFIDQGKLQAFEPRLRNQLFGRMHAHNELTTFNRLLPPSTTLLCASTHDFCAVGSNVVIATSARRQAVRKLEHA